MKKILLIGGGSALLLLCILFGAFFAGPLLAAARSGQTTSASTPAATNPYCQQYLQDLAKRLGSSQSRVAKLERGALGVTLDLLFRALFVAGASTDEVARELRSRRRSAA